MATIQLRCELGSRAQYVATYSVYMDAVDAMKYHQETPGMRTVELRELTEDGRWITLKLWARL